MAAMYHVLGIEFTWNFFAQHLFLRDIFKILENYKAKRVRGRVYPYLSTTLRKNETQIRD